MSTFVGHSKNFLKTSFECWNPFRSKKDSISKLQWLNCGSSGYLIMCVTHGLSCLKLRLLCEKCIQWPYGPLTNSWNCIPYVYFSHEIPSGCGIDGAVVWWFPAHHWNFSGVWSRCIVSMCIISSASQNSTLPLIALSVFRYHIDHTVSYCSYCGRNSMFKFRG